MNTGIEYDDIEVQCATHGTQSVQLLKSFDGIVLPIRQPGCPECRKEAKQAEEAKRREEERVERVKRLIGNAGIPVRYGKATFEDYRTPLPGQARALDVSRRYVASIANKAYPGWLVLTGKPGTGKSMLLSCMARLLAGHFIASRYTTQSAMGREFRASYQRDAVRSEAELFSSYANVPVLLLDELGAGSTEHTDRLLFEVLDERYANRLPVVIATNHPREALDNVLGERLHDRLKEEATFVAFDWESARQPAGLRRKAA